MRGDARVVQDNGEKMTLAKGGSVAGQRAEMDL